MLHRGNISFSEGRKVLSLGSPEVTKWGVRGRGAQAWLFGEQREPSVADS